METKEVKTVRVEHLEYLNDVKKNALAFMETVNPIELADNQLYAVVYGRVIKLKANYLKLANAQRKKLGIEPLKKAGKLPWGEWEIEGVLINHNGDHYLRYYPYDGELQERTIEIIDEHGEMVPLQSKAYEQVYDAWKGSRSNKSSVCRSINVAHISQLFTLNKEGNPDVDIIYEKLA